MKVKCTDKRFDVVIHCTLRKHNLFIIFYCFQIVTFKNVFLGTGQDAIGAGFGREQATQQKIVLKILTVLC